MLSFVRPTVARQLGRHRPPLPLLPSPLPLPPLRCWLSTTGIAHDRLQCKVLILGAGSGGCAVAAQLNRALGAGSVTVVEPADRHYYQPMFTMIGGGMNQLSDAFKPMADVIPAGVRWLRDTALHIDAAASCVHTADGHQIAYEQLLVAVGLRPNYERVPGLSEALAQPDGNVTSIYAPQHVHRHYAALQRFRGGPVLFTFPLPPIKCPGAPQKIAYISEHYLRQRGLRAQAQLTYVTALPVIFSAPYFADALWPIARSRGIDVRLQQHLVEVRPTENRAVFESVERPGERLELEYALLHVTPPQEVPPLLRQSIGAADSLVNAGGMVDVDAATMRHVRYGNVWAVGDCTSTPNSKTMAAAGECGTDISVSLLSCAS